jgi:hypothetical protein
MRGSVEGREERNRTQRDIHLKERKARKGEREGTRYISKRGRRSTNPKGRARAVVSQLLAGSGSQFRVLDNTRKRKHTADRFRNQVEINSDCTRRRHKFRVKFFNWKRHESGSTGLRNSGNQVRR